MWTVESIKNGKSKQRNNIKWRQQKNEAKQSKAQRGREGDRGSERSTRVLIQKRNMHTLRQTADYQPLCMSATREWHTTHNDFMLTGIVFRSNGAHNICYSKHSCACILSARQEYGNTHLHLPLSLRRAQSYLRGCLNHMRLRTRRILSTINTHTHTPSATQHSACVPLYLAWQPL